MKRKRNLKAYEAWMARKREGRPQQVWDGEQWVKVFPATAETLLAEIFGAVA
jgi:hypothetical protein